MKQYLSLRIQGRNKESWRSHHCTLFNKYFDYFYQLTNLKLVLICYTIITISVFFISWSIKKIPQMSMLIVANRIHGFNFSGPDRFDLLSALIENIGQLFPNNYICSTSNKVGNSSDH